MESIMSAQKNQEPLANVSDRGYPLSSWSVEQIDQRVSELASAPDGAEVLRIMRHNGTEPSGTSAYATIDGTRGTYMCRLCSLPLFSTRMQYHAETGWPSFTGPYSSEHVVLAHRAGPGRMAAAYGLLPGQPVCCARCASHLGHLFMDRGGSRHLARYCIDGTALSRVPTGNGRLHVAYLAGGCFWHMQWVLNKLDGVVGTAVGYANGDIAHPSYTMVCDHKKHSYGFSETVQVVYTRPLTYSALLRAFLAAIDPFDGGGQGANRGVPQYAPSMLYVSDVQRITADRALASIPNRPHQTVAVAVRPIRNFYRAENYHQMYILKMVQRATRDVRDPVERARAEERLSEEFYDAGHSMEVYSERYRKFTQR